MDHLQGKKIGFIGAGQMAEAIFGGNISSGRLNPADITVTDISPARLEELSRRLGISTIPNDSENQGVALLVQGCDIIVFSVKPQYLRPILEAAAPHFDPGRHLAISIVGGAPLSLLEAFLPVPVVRVMPNTPMLVGEGVSGIALGSLCTSLHGDAATQLFSGVGQVHLLPESLIDPLTSVSGCGPAYAYIFMEALSDGGVKMGLSRDVALQLAAQTLLGSAKMVLQGEHPGKLKDNVCSPGGSTIAGVHALEKGCFRGTVINAVEAAMERTVEVGKKI